MTEQEQGAIILKVNDLEIPMNPFVETVFLNVIMGMLDSLDKIPRQKEKIEIVISRGT